MQAEDSIDFFYHVGPRGGNRYVESPYFQKLQTLYQVGVIWLHKDKKEREREKRSITR